MYLFADFFPFNFVYYTKFELNSLRNNEITMKLLITDIFGCHTKRKSEMTSYLNNGYDVMNYFAKFEKFLTS